MKTKHTFKYWQWRVIICSMIGYALFYFVRKNFAFAMPSLGEEYGITNTSFGIILSLVGIIYGISKFVNGIIADRTVARWHLAIGLAACSVFNLLFGWSDKLSMLITGQTGGAEFVSTMVIIMATLLVLNNVFQGCGFPPCNHLLAWWVPPKELATKTAVWNTSHSIGAALAAVFCGYIIARTGTWRYCFFAPAAIGFAGVVFIVLTLRDTPSSVGLPDLPDTKTEIDNDDTPEAFRAFVKRKVFLNPVIWLLAVTDLFVYIVRFAVLDWGPTFLQQRQEPLSPELAGWTIGIFEIAGLLGMLAAGWISDHFFHSKTHRVRGNVAYRGVPYGFACGKEYGLPGIDTHTSCLGRILPVRASGTARGNGIKTGNEESRFIGSWNHRNNELCFGNLHRSRSRLVFRPLRLGQPLSADGRCFSDRFYIHRRLVEHQR